MSSGHSHGAHSHGSTGNLKSAFFLNLTFTIIEIFGGLWTNSVAILSDAVHDLGDSLSLGLAWYFDRLSRREDNAKNTYGYRRYSLLGGLITAVVLIAGLAFILWHAVGRLFSPEPVNAPGVMMLAVVGVVFNGAAVLKVKKGSSLTEQVVSWHLLEDTLGWVAVLVGAGIMTVWDLPIIDPILSIGISFFVLWNVLRNLRQFFTVFLQRTPKEFDVNQFERTVLALPKVTSVHHTHSWSIDGESHVLTTHLVMQKDADRDEIIETKNQVRDMLDKKTFEHVTVDIELEGEACMASQEHKHTQTQPHNHAH
ncbi:cation diffusion facilitator family transporter [Oxalobacteraceae bacterium R-40]|uniref:Cation diffusion facilitator family transporter n=1 Tax=Keguizhuia sedimenti TaxID=3064264 RepID=A0ABU1BTE3_9BURK|nr:cation diffusion facilitator family transporter [Oxalobacteraceae bacterium R-40]